MSVDFMALIGRGFEKPGGNKCEFHLDVACTWFSRYSTSVIASQLKKVSVFNGRSSEEFGGNKYEFYLDVYLVVKISTIVMAFLHPRSQLEKWVFFLILF